MKFRSFRQKLVHLWVPLFDEGHGVYIFHHMPKCGGTAFRIGLEKWFKIKADYITVPQLCGDVPVDPPLDLTSLDKNSCVCSHFECQFNHLPIRYPEALRDRRRYFVFSFVRDPLMLSISLYYHSVKVGRLDPGHYTLTDYLGQQSNYMAQRFPCTKSNYKRVLQRYAFIGLQEDMSASVIKLAEMLGREPFEVPISNKSPRDQQESSLSQNIVHSFKSRNALDYAIYDYVRQRFL